MRGNFRKIQKTKLKRRGGDETERWTLVFQETSIWFLRVGKVTLRRSVGARSQVCFAHMATGD